MSKMYPPCMYDQTMRHRTRDDDPLTTALALIKYMEKRKEKEKPKEDWEHNKKAHKWQLVEIAEPRKYSFFETVALVCLLSFPVCLAEVLAGQWVLYWLGFK